MRNRIFPVTIKSMKILEKGHAKGLVATNTVVSLAVSHSLAKDFVDPLLITPVPSGFIERYYD